MTLKLPTMSCYDNNILKIFWARSWVHLYINTAILKTIHSHTGSQCRDLKSGVIWSYFDLLKTILAAKFCIL